PPRTATWRISRGKPRQVNQHCPRRRGGKRPRRRGKTEPISLSDRSKRHWVSRQGQATSRSISTGGCRTSWVGLWFVCGQAGIVEVKDREDLTNKTDKYGKKQLEVFAAEAKKRGVPFNVIISPDTDSISKSVVRLVQDSGGVALEFNPKTKTFTQIDISKLK